MKNKLSVALIQQCCVEEKILNFQNTAKRVRDAAKAGAALVVLQELHGTRYFCQTEDTSQFDLADSIPGEDTAFFSKLAAECGVVLVTSLFEKRAAGLYHNTAVVFERDGQIAGVYRKMHIPDDPGYYEKFYFTPGDLGFQPIQTSVGRLGVLVCWDQWYPEAARLMVMNGADLLIYPTAIGWNPLDESVEQQRQLDAWLTVQRGHAVANGVPVLAVNRVGFEPDPANGAGSLFWGNSFAVGPQGEWLTRGSGDQEEILHVEIDFGRIEEVRRIWPFFRDRRIDAFAGLVRRYGNE